MNTLKLLIIGADAVAPEYILEKAELFPNISQLKEKGASAAYSAYVQKGYGDSYLSEMNWSSIYTGLSPREHRIAQKDKDGERKKPIMTDYKELYPLWEVLNKSGFKVGMWAPFCCSEPIEIDGYVVSVDCETIETPVENRISKRTIHVCEKDKDILDYLHGTPPIRLYPKTLKQQGYEFEKLKEDEELAWKAVTEYHFQEAVRNFEEELEYYYLSIKAVQEYRPVDVLYLYTPTTDLVAHCCMYSDDNETLIKLYQVLDGFVGKMMELLEPENTIFLSDHGMINFRELIKTSDKKIQREAFAARDEVLWLKNGYIAFEAHNGALLFTAHSLKGTFVAAGKNIRHSELQEMRTLDVYPTIMEMLGIKIVEERAGFVMDMFNHSLVNGDKLLIEKDVRYNSIALVQCHQPSITDIILNELYIEKRFSSITLVGNKRYEEIYRNNPRVSAFVSYEDFCIDDYDEVYCGVYNEITNIMNHMRVK